jgi:hypothetical protein
MLCILGGREIWYRQFANCDISVPSSLLRRTIEKSVRYHRHINTLVRFACSPRKRKMFDSTIFETIAVDHQTPLSENLPSNEEEWQQFRKDIYDRHDLEEVITTPMAATQEAAAAPETLPAAPTVTATAVVTETVELPTGRVVEDKRTIMPPIVDAPTVVPVMGFRRPSATTYDSKTEKAVIDRLLTMKQLTVHCECALISYVHRNPSFPAFSYIGMSKLSCKPCHLWLSAYNQHANSGRYYTKGSHEKWCLGWKTPLLDEKTQAKVDDVLVHMVEEEFCEKEEEMGKARKRIRSSDGSNSSGPDPVHIVEPGNQSKKEKVR